MPAPWDTSQLTDITSTFCETVKDLELGELIHDSTFSLYEAMSAIEMMDPKMDAGMLCNRGVRQIKSFDQAVEENILKLNNFEDKEIIGIIDSTFACLATWLEGHSLAKTVFINLYLHKPYKVEDKILKVFCLSIYKIMQAIKNLIDSAMVYEEEDFQSLQYGYHLNPDVSEHRMFNMLRDVEENLERRLRSKPNNETQAISTRIKFTKLFLQVLISFGKDQTHSITDRHKLLNVCLEMLSLVQETIPLGIENEDLDSELLLGLVPSINQRLLPPTFPRYTKIKTRTEAMKYFTRMIEQFKIVCKIQSISPLHQALDFFIDFSQSNPCILSRSVLQLLYIGTNDTALKDSLKDAIKSFICPPAMFSNTLLKNDEARLHIDNFLNRCSGPFRNFLQLCGHNRARQRDKLVYLLEEFVELQYNAERLDAYLHNILSVNYLLPVSHMACFGTWVLYYTLRIMIMYVLSGFELELYSVHEFYYIYWYLYEHLYGWLISALSRAETFLSENEIIIDSQKSKGANKNRTKNTKKARPYKRDISYLKALQIMCGGYYKALVGFRLEGKLTMPNPLFDNEQVRYQHRFAPFQNILTPPPVQYAEFREMTTFEMDQQQSVNSIFLYIDGCNHFHQARQLLECIPANSEITDLLTICKTNFVVLKLLAGGHKKDSKIPPDFDFSKSKYFPIIKLN